MILLLIKYRGGKARILQGWNKFCTLWSILKLMNFSKKLLSSPLKLAHGFAILFFFTIFLVKKQIHCKTKYIFFSSYLACCLVHWHPGKQLCDLAALPHNHDGIGSSTKSTLEKDDIPILNFGGQPFYYYYSLVTYFLNTDFFWLDYYYYFVFSSNWKTRNLKVQQQQLKEEEEQTRSKIYFGQLTSVTFVVLMSWPEQARREVATAMLSQPQKTTVF